MIKTDLSAEGIILEDVVEKETHALQTFSVLNEGDDTIRVSLSTSKDLHGTIQFQTSNENFEGDDELSLPLSASIQPDYFNQVCLLLC